MMKIQKILTGVILSGFALGGVAQAAELTPEQLKAKATLEQAYSCEQKIKPAEAVSLLKLLGATKDKTESTGFNLKTPLKLFGIDVRNVRVGPDIFDNDFAFTFGEGLSKKIHRAYSFKLIRKGTWSYYSLKTKKGELSSGTTDEGWDEKDGLEHYIIGCTYKK